jgi:hypothetical protein
MAARTDFLKGRRAIARDDGGLSRSSIPLPLPSPITKRFDAAGAGPAKSDRTEPFGGQVSGGKGGKTGVLRAYASLCHVSHGRLFMS